MALVIDPSQLKRCKNCLVSIEKPDGDVIQGRVVDVLPDIPALIMQRPFKNGCPLTNDKYALNVSATDAIRVVDSSPIDSEPPQRPPPPQKQAPNAKTANKTKQKGDVAPKAAATAPKKSKKKARQEADVVNKGDVVTTAASTSALKAAATKQPSESLKKSASSGVVAVVEETSQIRVLKRGENAILNIDEFSSSCVIRETPPALSVEKRPTKLELIPAQVLNSKKANKTLLDKLLTTQAINAAKSVDVTVSAAPQSSSQSSLSSAVVNGTRIDVNLLLGSPTTAATSAISLPSTKPTASAAAPRSDGRQTEHRVFGDFKHFTTKQEPNLQSVVSQPPVSIPPQLPSRNGRSHYASVSGGGPSGNPVVDTTNGYSQLYADDELNEPLDLDAIKEDFDFCGNLALFRKEETTETTSSSTSPGVVVSDEGEDAYPPLPPPGIVYEEKPTANYRNDENVIADPRRVMSWVPNRAAQPALAGAKTAATTRQWSASTTQRRRRDAGSKSPAGTKTPTTNAAPSNSASIDEYGSITLRAQQTILTEDGFRLPVLKAASKKLFTASAIRLYNEHIYSCIAADRFADFVMNIHNKHKINANTMLVVAGQGCDPVLLHRFCQFFINRTYKITIYDPPAMPGSMLSLTNNVIDVDELPRKPRAIYLLCASTFHSDEDLRRYILRLSRPNATGAVAAASKDKKAYPRLVGLDFRLFDVKHMHSLFLGVADETVLNQGRQRNVSGEGCTFEAVVTDMGTPFNWIQCAESTHLAALKNSISCRLAT